MHFDFTVSLTTIIQFPILAGIGYILRFVSIQKDYPPHRHVNGKIIYPKDYTPDQAQSMTAGH